MAEFNKKELLALIVERTGLDLEDVTGVYETLVDVTAEHLAKEARVEYKEFGVFSLESRQGRSGVFAPTGKEWSTPDRLVIQFKPAKHFVEVANKFNDREFEITNKK